MYKILKYTKDYQVLQKGNIYLLEYFDEMRQHPKYDKHKPVTLSRVTKNKDFINQVLEAN